MEKLNKDELFLLAIELDLPSLLNFCLTSKRFNEVICKKESFWVNKLDRDYSNYKENFNDKTPREKYTLIYQKIILSTRDIHWLDLLMIILKP